MRRGHGVRRRFEDVRMRSHDVVAKIQLSPQGNADAAAGVLASIAENPRGLGERTTIGKLCSIREQSDR